LPKLTKVIEISSNMLEIMKASIGTSGPLLVEHRGCIMCEHCIIITQDHVNRMVRKLRDISFTKIEQTSDRSFLTIN
jgi:hypothetical protein